MVVEWKDTVSLISSSLLQDYDPCFPFNVYVPLYKISGFTCLEPRRSVFG